MLRDVGRHRPDRSSYVLQVKGAAEKVNAAWYEMGAEGAEGKVAARDAAHARGARYVIGIAPQRWERNVAKAVQPKGGGGNLAPAKPPLLQRFTGWTKSFFGVASIIFVLALIGMAVSAAHSGGVVIERLEVPHGFMPAAADRADLPAQVLNRLTRLRVETRSLDSDHAAAEVPAAEWLEDYRVQIPETGIAISDLYAFLRRTLGHDIYVRGDLYQTTEKVEGKDQVRTFVTVWNDNRPVTKEIRPGDDVVTAIAEAFYEEAYPYLAIVHADQSRTLPLPEV